MKLLLLIILLHIVNIGFSQKAKIALSNIEKTLNKTGTLLVKEYIEAGDVDGFKFEAIKIVELSTNQKISGLRISFKQSGKDIATFLDSDELDLAIKSLETIRDNTYKKPLNITEYVYSTRSGFQISTLTFLGAWILQIDIDKFDNEDPIRLEFVNLLKLIKAIDKARVIMKQ